MRIRRGREHPSLNARWQKDALVLNEGIHIGVAVDTEAGLVVPVVRDADRLTVDQIAERLRDLAERARSRAIRGRRRRAYSFEISVSIGTFANSGSA